MGKIDFGLYSGTMLLCLFLGTAAYRYDHNADKASNRQDPYRLPWSIGGQNPAYSERHTEGDPKDTSKNIRVTIEPGPLTGRDVILFTLNVLSGVGVLASIAFAGYNLRYLRKQTSEIQAQRVAMQATLEAMHRQAKTMEIQSEHLKDSVELSFKNWLTTEKSLLAMKSKERARLSLEIAGLKFKTIPVVDYKLSCHGTTPAYVVDSWHGVIFLPVDDAPWMKSDFGMKWDNLPSVISTSVISEYFIIHGAGTLLTYDPVVEEEVKRGDKFIQFRAWIKYEDIFEGSHTLYFSKIYGVRKDKLSFWGNLLGYPRPPEWYQSAWQEPEEE